MNDSKRTEMLTNNEWSKNAVTKTRVCLSTKETASNIYIKSGVAMQTKSCIYLLFIGYFVNIVWNAGNADWPRIPSRQIFQKVDHAFNVIALVDW